MPVVHPQTIQRTVAWLGICTALVAGWEGLATRPYKDHLAGGLVTWCYGETHGNVKMSDVFTPARCKEMLAARLPEYRAKIEKCIKVPLTENQWAATVSLAYNVGPGAVCGSTYVRQLNARDPNACDYMLRYNRASGRVIQGLVNRRKAEWALCRAPDKE